LKKSETFVFLAVVILSLALQWAGGAFRSDFDRYPDEAAHVVSSLLVRDYLTSGFPHNPLSFARVYYDHFPKVAIGRLPPFFHATEAIWTLISDARKSR
jgi:hypothetical protein